MKTPLIEACIKWVEETEDRNMQINYDSRYPHGNRIWLYSYKTGAGVSVKSLQDIPTEKDLILKAKKDLEERLEAIGK